MSSNKEQEQIQQQVPVANPEGEHGTEYVAPLLAQIIKMVRPVNVLEVGIGYTTKFIADALESNRLIATCEVSWVDREYIEGHVRGEKAAVFTAIDIMHPLDLSFMTKDLTDYSYVHLNLVNDTFRGLANELSNKYGKFDFVWYDCGWVPDYIDFIREYWPHCSGYVVFHHTYNDGVPNETMEAILQSISGEYQIMDFVEPHKRVQGSITIIRKIPSAP